MLMKIYIDSDFRCHINPSDGLTEIETDVFDGCCTEFIEGYRFVPAGETWTREDGDVFHGVMLSPWKPYNELAAAQREYERGYESELAEAARILLGEVVE